MLQTSSPKGNIPVTHDDSLQKELRIDGLSDIDDGNTYNSSRVDDVFNVSTGSTIINSSLVDEEIVRTSRRSKYSYRIRKKQQDSQIILLIEVALNYK